jgi:hypothetical protein
LLERWNLVGPAKRVKLAQSRHRRPDDLGTRQPRAGRAARFLDDLV